MHELDLQAGPQRCLSSHSLLPACLHKHMQQGLPRLTSGPFLCVQMLCCGQAASVACSADCKWGPSCLIRSRLCSLAPGAARD